VKRRKRRRRKEEAYNMNSHLQYKGEGEEGEEGGEGGCKTCTLTYSTKEEKGGE
jgi:hypothetical protein